MANPRKFSEKIALHTQKQAEETAAFEKIMREVSDATSKGNPMPKQHLRINQNLGSFRGGSLPNVNKIATTSSGELKSALSNLEEMNRVRGDSQIVYRERGRTMGVGGPMRSRPVERKIDTSPYSSGPYLSPPPADNGWRRTNSDSALHTSAQTTDSLHSPGSQRRALESHGQLTDGYEPCRRHLSVSPDGRPRSCCDVPRVPGINIFPSAQEPGTIQIPIGNNTGSLPDLTSFHFPSPLPTPLDQEDPNSSPYSNNHLSVPSQLNSRFLHKCKGVTLDNSSGASQHVHDAYSSHQPHQPQVVYQQQPHPQPQQAASPQLQSPCSPLAQTSPPVPAVYNSVSPLSSSPQSPSSPSSTGPIAFPDHNSYYISQAQANLQAHFEQFSMMDSPASLDYIGSTNNVSPYSQTDDNFPQELTQDPGYFSTSPSQQLQYSRHSHSAQTTPNTPSSIPDIVLTDYVQIWYDVEDNLYKSDFSNTADELAIKAEAELGKDFICPITAGLDADLFPSDDCLREGLGPLDFDGLQMLTDSTEIISDPNVEEHFRLDRIQ